VLVGPPAILARSRVRESLAIASFVTSLYGSATPGPALRSSAASPSPGFTAAAIVTLALGIGANATVFTLINTLLFHPFAVKEPQQLVTATTFSPALMPMNLSIGMGNNFRIWG
jgi:hypothetical protein